MNGSGIGWEAAANHWTDREVSEAHIPEGELITEIEKFLGRHKICALAAAGARIMRNTTVEYVHAGGTFWIVSEGSLKFRALQANNSVCLVIHNEDISFDTLAGLQITGTARVLESFGAEYEHACLLRSIPVERLRKLSFVMSAIKVVPMRYDCVNGRLKERDLNARQHVDL